MLLVRNYSEETALPLLISERKDRPLAYHCTTEGDPSPERVRYLENYFVRRAQKGIHTRLIYPVSDFGSHVARKSLEYKIQVRVLDDVPAWRAGVFSWDDYLGIQSLTEGRLTCTILRNKDIAEFWRSIIFPALWARAKRIS